MSNDGDVPKDDDERGNVTKLEDRRRQVAADLERQAKGDGKKPPARSKKQAPKPASGGGGAGIQRPEVRQLPPEAPVRALGTAGNRVYFLDAHSQLRDLNAKDLSRTMILHLFGRETGWIYDLWPQRKMVGEEWRTTGWDGSKAQEAMMRAAACQIWEPARHVRGRGAWRLEDGRLVVHTGAALHVSDGKVARPGIVGEHVYPAAPRAAAPAVPGEEGELDGRTAAEELLELLRTWAWARDFDAELLLGWIVAAMLGGALRVRPLVWVTGDKGTGKSSLVGQDGVIHRLFGDGILTTANTTAAGLYQEIGYDSLPVAVDEIEAKRGNQKTEQVIELARQAFSGSVLLRGGQDHEGQSFKAQTCFLFGSILIPPLLPQDMSRMAILRLDPFAEGAVEPKLDPKRLERIGRALLRRCLSQWHQWDERLDLWRDHLRSMGHDGRAADQFGTLLAAADFALRDEAPSDMLMDDVAIGMAPSNLSETATEDSNATRCVSYAMSRQVSSLKGGEILTVGELVTCAIRRFGGEMENPIKPTDAVRYLERSGVSVVLQRYESGKMMTTKVNKVGPADLSRAVDKPWNGDAEGVFVAVSPDGDGILELFRGSDWEGIAGAHNPFAQAIERVPGAFKLKSTLRVNGRKCRPLLVPLAECIDVPTASEAQWSAAPAS